MRYRIVCPACEEQYFVDVSFEPVLCFKCGHKEVIVSTHKTQAKVDAGIVMAELNELAPRIDAAYDECERAYEAYEILMQNWRDGCRKLRTYKDRKVISKEDYEEYSYRYRKRGKENE